VNWSRSTTLVLGVASAASVLYLLGFIPLLFLAQDSANPPVGTELEHGLLVLAGFAMFTYAVCELCFLVHALFGHGGSLLRRFGWALAIVATGPVAMAFYWRSALWPALRRTAAPPDPGAN
jgi:hypothetical protein